MLHETERQLYEVQAQHDIVLDNIVQVCSRCYILLLTFDFCIPNFTWFFLISFHFQDLENGVAAPQNLSEELEHAEKVCCYNFLLAMMLWPSFPSFYRVCCTYYAYRAYVFPMMIV